MTSHYVTKARMLVRDYVRKHGILTTQETREIAEQCARSTFEFGMMFAAAVLAKLQVTIRFGNGFLVASAKDKTETQQVHIHKPLDLAMLMAGLTVAGYPLEEPSKQ